MVYINHEQPLPHLTLQQLCHAQQHHAQYCIILYQYFHFFLHQSIDGKLILR